MEALINHRTKINTHNIVHKAILIMLALITNQHTKIVTTVFIPTYDNGVLIASLSIPMSGL